MVWRRLNGTNDLKGRINDAKALSGLMTDLSGHSITLEDMLNRLQFVATSKFNSIFVCEEIGKNDRLQRVGSFMMEYTESLARESGCKRTWLVSGFAREKEAHLFYKQLGYQQTGYRFVKLVDNSGGRLNPPPSNG